MNPTKRLQCGPEKNSMEVAQVGGRRDSPTNKAKHMEECVSAYPFIFVEVAFGPAEAEAFAFLLQKIVIWCSAED